MKNVKNEQQFLLTKKCFTNVRGASHRRKNKQDVHRTKPTKAQEASHQSVKGKNFVSFLGNFET
jgi:hypothetical protein